MNSEKTNLSRRVKAPEHREQRFSLRKFSFGAASILVGSLLFLGPVASADDLSAQPTIVNDTTLDENQLNQEVPTDSSVALVDDHSQESSAEKVAAEEITTPSVVSETLPSSSEVISDKKEVEEDSVQPVADKPKWVTKQYVASNTQPTDPSNNAMPRPVNEGQALPEGTDFRASSPFKNFEDYSDKSIEQLKQRITWIDFANTKDIQNYDIITVDGKKEIAIKVGTTFTKELAPGYVVTVKVKELKPFENSTVYKERLTKEGLTSLPGESRVNENLRNPNVPNNNRIIAVPLDQYSTVKNNGYDVPGKVQLRSAVDGANVGVVYEVKATYLGKEVPANIVLANAEENLGPEMSVYTTNGDNFELLAELAAPDTKWSYRPMDWDIFAKDFLKQDYFKKKEQIISKWLNVNPEASSQQLPGRSKESDAKNAVVVGDGVGTKVFGPVQDYAYAKYSAPILFTRNASEIGVYMMANGRLGTMMGVMLVDEGDAPESYGSGAHAISVGPQVVKQPYLGKVIADIDFDLKDQPANKRYWNRDETSNTGDEGAGQLMGDAVKKNNNYTAHYANSNTYTLDIVANGNTKNAYVQGWVDFNNNGKFDANEGSGVIPVKTTEGKYKLTFSNIPQISDPNLTKLGVRVRIANDEADVRTPDLLAYSGEVEDFQIQVVHPPRGSKEETRGRQGETQRTTVNFTAAGLNNYETTAAKIDEKVAPQIVKPDGSLVKSSELVDGYYVIAGEGKYKVTGSGQNVAVEFVPEANFFTEDTKGTKVRQAQGITIRRTGTTQDDKNKATTTGWSSDTNISEQTNTMDGRYIPHVIQDNTQKAILNYVVRNSDGSETPVTVPGIETTTVTGKPNTVISFADKDANKAKLEKLGYTVVDDTFNKATNKNFDNDLTKDQTFKVVVTPKLTTLTEDKTVNRTVTYVKRDAVDNAASETHLDQAGKPVSNETPYTNSVEFTRTGTRNEVTKEVTWGDWQLKNKANNNNTLEGKALPKVDGYKAVAATKTVDGQTTNVNPSTTTQNISNVTAATKDVVEKVIYVPNTQAARVYYKQVPNEQSTQESDIKGVTPEDKTGLSGTPITFDNIAKTIADLESKGYKVVSNGYDSATKQAKTYDNDPNKTQEFKVVVTPKQTEVTEEKTVSRTVSYVKRDSVNDTASETNVDKNGQPVDQAITYTNTVDFVRTGTRNEVTKEVTWNAWQPKGDRTLEGTPLPTVEGYRPETTIKTVGTRVTNATPESTTQDIRNVSATAISVVEKVVYTPKPVEVQAARVYYKQVPNAQSTDESDIPGVSPEDQSGTAGTAITFNNLAETLEDLKKKGYEVVSNAYESADEEAKKYDDVSGNTQEFKVVVTPRIVPITSVPTPDEPVDPNDPEGPKWPTPKTPLNPEDFHKDIYRTTTFVKEEDGQEVPAGIAERQDGVTFKRSTKINLVTGEVEAFTAWEATDNGDNTFDGSTIPTLEGYTVSRVETNKEGSLTKTELNAVTVSPEDKNIVEKVVYKPIPKPEKATVTFVFESDEQVPGTPTLNKEGEAGSVIPSTDVEDELAKLIEKGYEKVTNPFDTPQNFDNNPDVDQTFKVVVRPKITPVDPEEKVITRTVSYVKIDQEGGQETEAAPTKSNSVTYTRTGEVNEVTDVVSYTDWTAKDGDKDLDGTPLPFVKGYIAKKVETTVESTTLTQGPETTEKAIPTEENSKNVVEKVVYVKLGSWVPKIPADHPEVPSTPLPYPNDPNKDPKVPGTPTDPGVPVIPYVPGYTPEGPTGPLEPKVPGDPTQGYIPPTLPEDPTKNIDIPYVKNPVDQLATLVYVERTPDGKEKAVEGVDNERSEGKTTTDITFPNYTDNLEKLRAKGYDVVSDSYKDASEEAKKFDNDDNVTQAFKVIVTPRIVPITKVPTPGEPVDPNDPEGPKWPTPNTPLTPEDFNKNVTRTTTFVKDDKGTETEAAPTKTDSVNFTRTTKINLVTGEVEPFTAWVAKADDTTFEGSKVPVVEGYYVKDEPTTNRENSITKTDLNTVSNLTGDDANVVEKVVYKPLGSWVITTPPGETPNDPIKYPNHPTDPTKPKDPNDPGVPVIPYIPGHTPEGPTGPLTPKVPGDPTQGYIPPTPATPGEDTPINYVPEKPVTPPVVAQKATVTFVDDKGNKVPDTPTLAKEGESGSKIPSQDVDDELTKLINKGYEKVTNPFDTPQNFDKDPNVDQSFEVVVRPKVTPISPENPGKPGEPIDPNNPNGPRWPEGTDKASLEKVITRTVSYVKVDQEGGQETEAAPTQENSVTYTRTGDVNHVTGEVTYTDWTAKDGDKDLDGTPLPFVKGYIAKKVETTVESTTLTQGPETTEKAIPTEENSKNVVEKVVYVKLGSWVPKIPADHPEVPSTPLPYPNDPNKDPKVPGTPTDPGVPVIPYVPGYTPEGPTGPLEPKVPGDPTQGYIPPTLPEDPTKNIDIPYVKNPVDQLATLVYVERTPDGKEKAVEGVDNERSEGKTTTDITFPNYTDNLEKLRAKGYDVVSDSYKDASEEAKKFDNDDNVTQAFKVIVTPRIVPITKVPTPGEPVDPNDPEGPKWPTPNTPLTPEDFNKNVTRTTTFVKDDKGTETEAAPTKTDSVNFTRTTKINLVTGEVEPFTAWVAKADDTTFEGSKVPVVEGYYVKDEPTTNRENSITKTDLNTVSNLTGDDANVVEKVVYKPLGSWVITTPPGETPNDPIKYPNHPTDPTKPKDPNDPGVPVIPYIPGHTPEGPTGPLTPKVPGDPTQGYIPPTPATPGEDTPINYVPEKPVTPPVVAQKATVTFVDDKGNKVPDTPTLAKEGESGSKIPSQDVDDELTKLINKGYEKVTNPFDTPQNFDKDPNVDQSFEVVVRPKVTPISPENPGKPGEPIDPNNPNGPRWPEGTDKASLEKVITRTVSYVKVDQEGGQETEAAPTQENSVTYTRTGDVNHVTGEVTYTDWTAKDGDKDLDGTPLPFVKGYIAKKVETTVESTTLTQGPETTEKAIPTEENSKNVVEKVVYVKLGSWVPKIPADHPEVPSTPLPYPNDPNKDPKVPGTPTDPGVPVIPYVPGYTPNDPNGNPLTPVDPADPSKGYVPPVLPEDPTADTPITYVTQKATVTFVDDKGNKVPDTPTLAKSGESGSKIPSQDVDDELTKLINKGYEKVTNPFDTPQNFDKDPNVDQSFEVVVRPKVTPISPENPGKPGEPIDPNNPNGPRWPEGTDKASLEKLVTRTTQYVKVEGDQLVEVADTVTTAVTYTRTATVNHVTGAVTYTDWTAKDDDKVLEGNKLPFVKGYIATTTVDAKTETEIDLTAPEKDLTTTVDSQDVHEVVVYKKLGSWVPKIPADHPEVPSTPLPYPNDPNKDPKVPGTPTDPGVPVIPYVPGYTPNDPNGNPLTPVDPADPSKGYVPPVLPNDPGQDTEIPYVKDPVPIPDVIPMPTPEPMPTPDVTPEPLPIPDKMVASRVPVKAEVVASAKLEQLPETGETGSVATTAFGLGSILASLGLVAPRRRKKD